ncbi:MAG: hypothetical protein IT292_09265 [Deltaproteobacteria bacterium]|nr:hypothetical protein [Deltaproteobacteria bacterium]
MSRIITALSLIALTLIAPALSNAQVALTVGVEEIYDQNIYLEDDNNMLVIPDNVDRSQIGDITPYDGDPNEDYITNVYLSASGSIPLSRHLKTAAEGRLGSMFFAENSDESRLTLDTLATMESEESLLAKPWFFKLSSDFNSQSGDITVSDGATAKQSESHLATFDLGIKKWEFSQSWDLSTNYRLQRMDYLDMFTFSDSALESQDGADYLANGLVNEIGYKYSETLRFVLTSSVDYFSYTSTGDDADFVEKDDLNRIAYDSRMGIRYQPEEKLALASNVGFEANHYPDREFPQANVTNSETPSASVSEADNDEMSFVYDVSGSYMFDPTSTLSLLFEQTTGNDISGASVSYRNLAVNFTKAISDVLSLNTGGRFMQYSDGDSISNATDRYEATIALSYALTEALSLSAGWNYVNQNASEYEVDSMLASDDYESHRAFIGISAGVIGVKQ